MDNGSVILLAVLSAAVSSVLLPLCGWALIRTVAQRDKEVAALWRRDEGRAKQIEKVREEVGQVCDRVADPEARLRYALPKNQ